MPDCQGSDRHTDLYSAALLLYAALYQSLVLHHCLAEYIQEYIWMVLAAAIARWVNSQNVIVLKLPGIFLAGVVCGSPAVLRSPEP